MFSTDTRGGPQGALRLFLRVSVVVTLVFVPSAFALLTIDSGNGNTTQFNTYRLPRIPTFQTVVGPIAFLPTPDRLPPDISNLNVSGKILVVDEIRYAFFLDWAFALANAQPSLIALAIVDGDEVSIGGVGSDILQSTKLPFPVVSVDFKTRDYVKSLNFSSAWATLDSNGLKTPWQQVHEHGLFLFSTTLICFASLALLILGLGRLIQFAIVEKSFTINVAKMVIIFETIGALLRLVYWVLDPLGSRGIYNDVGRTIWHTISIPFSVNATLLLTIYWHETVSRTSVKFSWSIDKFRVPAYLLATSIFLVEVIIDGLIIGRVKLPSLELSNAILYLVIALGLSIFFFITSGRVLFQLRKFSVSYQMSRAQKKTAVLVPVAIKLIIAGICWLGIIIVGLLTTSEAFYPRWEPIIVCTVWILVHSLMTIKAFSTLLALRPPRSSLVGTNASSRFDATQSDNRAASTS